MKFLFNTNKRQRIAVEKSNIIGNKTSFNVDEAYKSTRTNLMFLLKKEGCHKIAITSSLPGEGKTTTCINLAISIAQTGAKTLLIDADLRKPRIHKYFNFFPSPGLSNLLGDLEFEENLVRECHIPNLSIITSGPIPPNPAELLSRNSFNNLVDTLSKDYDFIIFDSPPLNIVSDASIISTVTDGVVLVVRQDVASQDNLKKSVENMEFANANILGFLINNVDFNRSRYRYRYSYFNKYSTYRRYGYGYGYSSNKKGD